MIPNFFSKKEMPKNIPEAMEKIVKELKKSASKQACLRKAYELLAKKYYGDRLMTYTHLFELFNADPVVLWDKRGYLHCTHINYLLRILLVKSGCFKDEDIKLKWTVIWYLSPHQYLEIRLNDQKTVNVDVWGIKYGIKFGDYAHGFH